MTLSKTQQAKDKIVKAEDHFNDLITKLENDSFEEMSPEAYGLPHDFKTKNELQEWIENNLKILKDGKEINIKLIPKQMKMIWDYWTRKTVSGILWKPRGGGGSLTVAIIIFLFMVWKKFSFKDLAGSGEQAKNVYDYVKGFFSEQCVGVRGATIVKGEPLKTNTELVTGPSLQCVPTSEKAARGKHPPGIVIDEACQSDPSVDSVIEAALNMVFSEKEYCIIADSTFHVPFGWFQDNWDNAELRDYVRYKWSIYDCMAQCDDEMDCRNCFLTQRIPVLNANGKIKKYKYTGCNGKARKSQGWLSRKNVIDAKKKNTAETYRVEYECHRPSTKGRVYPKEDCDRAFTRDYDLVKLLKNVRSSVGIDWGFDSQTAVILSQRHLNHIAVPNEAFFTGTSTSDIIAYLRRLKRKTGEFVVYADASHPFNNLDVANAGFKVQAVPFNLYKKLGIDNVAKYFEMSRLKISKECRILESQINKYRKDEQGRPVKSNDHGADGLMCSLLHFLFLNEFAIDEDGEVQDIGTQKEQQGGVILI